MHDRFYHKFMAISFNYLDMIVIFHFEIFIYRQVPRLAISFLNFQKEYSLSIRIPT